MSSTSDRRIRDQALMYGMIEMDFDTARRLFTLICVLHIK